MRIEVKNADNLATLVKAFPEAKVRALITRPSVDCWAVEIPDAERPPLTHQIEWDTVESGRGTGDAQRFIVNADFATACNLFDVLQESQTVAEVRQRKIPGQDEPREPKLTTLGVSDCPRCGVLVNAADAASHVCKLPAESPGTATDEELDAMGPDISEAEEVYIARREDGTLKTWVLFSKTKVIWGKPKETKREILKRWKKDNGPWKTLTKFKGLSRPSELAAAIASLQSED